MRDFFPSQYVQSLFNKMMNILYLCEDNSPDTFSKCQIMECFEDIQSQMSECGKLNRLELHSTSTLSNPWLEIGVKSYTISHELHMHCADSKLHPHECETIYGISRMRNCAELIVHKHSKKKSTVMIRSWLWSIIWI